MKLKSPYLVLAGIITLFGALACSHKEAKPDESANSYDVSPMKESDIFSSDKGNAQGLQSSHFPFNNYQIDKENREVLSEDAKILKGNPKLRVQIEGHCDQRGGIQYNLALGEKRAHAVKKFLQLHGVEENRLSIISFGKEKPLDTAETEEAYAKNRRANLVITAK